MTESLLDLPVYAPGVVAVREHPDVVRLQGMLEELAAVTGDPGQVGPMADCHRIEEMRRLEEVKAAAAAAQARVTVAFEASQLARQEAAGVRREQRGRGIGDQVALARGCPASQGSRHLGFAKAMAEMPHTLALLTRGRGRRVDRDPPGPRNGRSCRWRTARWSTSGSARCGSTPPPGWSTNPWVLEQTPRRVEGAARALAAELDPQAAVRRAAKATGQRRVTIRPTPDTMTYLTGLLPVAQGVAAWASLRAAARAAKAAGDERTESQLMADLFVQRLTGQTTADRGARRDPAGDDPRHPARHLRAPGPDRRHRPPRPDRPRSGRPHRRTPLAAPPVHRPGHRRRSPPSTPPAAASAPPTPGSSTPATNTAATRGATARSPTTTTSPAEPTADPPPAATAKASAKPTTWSRKSPAGTPTSPTPDPDTTPPQTTTPTGHTYRSQAPPGLPPPV